MILWDGTKKGARRATSLGAISRPRPAYRRALAELGEKLIVAILIAVGVIAVFQLGYGMGMAGGAR
jgi:hypothetical protein